MRSGRFLSYSKKKKKISQNDHSFSLVVIRCHFLSLVVSRFTTRRTTCCLSLVVIRWHSYHSLSLNVSLVCLFMNDLPKPTFCSYKDMKIDLQCKFNWLVSISSMWAKHSQITFTERRHWRRFGVFIDNLNIMFHNFF